MTPDKESETDLESELFFRDHYSMARELKSLPVPGFRLFFF